MFRLRAIHLALAFVAVSGIGFAAIDAFLVGRPAFPLDDAWIHLQFATRLGAGDGLAYTGDRWVTGSTAPLWSALLSLGTLLPGSLLLLWSDVLGALGLAGAVLGVHRLARELMPGRSADLAGFAAFLVATTPWLLWSAAAGMEITTFTCLALWGMVWHVRELRSPETAPPRSTALLAAATLARPEGAVLLGLALAERCLRLLPRPSGGGRGVRSAAKAVLPHLAVTILVTLPTLLFYRVAGGSFLPTTFWAKAGGPLDPWPDTRYLRMVLDLLVRTQPVLLLLAAGGALLLLARLRGPLDRGLLPAAWLTAQALAYSLLTRPGQPPPMGNFGRYWFPLLPVVTILGLLALTPLARRLRALKLWTPVLALVLAVQLPGLLALPATYADHVADVEASDVAAAHWLATRLDPAAYVAVQDVGALAFFLPNRLLDLAGLTSPEIRPVLFGGGTDSDGTVSSTNLGDWQARLREHLRREQVDVLVVFEDDYPGVVRAPGFRVVHAFRNPENRAMAGDVLLIVQTPWSRFPLPGS